VFCAVAVVEVTVTVDVELEEVAATLVAVCEFSASLPLEDSALLAGDGVELAVGFGDELLDPRSSFASFLELLRIRGSFDLPVGLLSSDLLESADGL
jgi:hypothetical protein